MNLIEAKAWADEMDMAVTVCDNNGIICYMNRASILNFHKYGGAELIGKSLYNCHNQQSCNRIKEMIDSPQSNTYIINKEGLQRLIHQTPWTDGVKTMGIIEISFNLPANVKLESV